MISSPVNAGGFSPPMAGNNFSGPGGAMVNNGGMVPPEIAGVWVMSQEGKAGGKGGKGYAGMMPTGTGKGNGKRYTDMMQNSDGKGSSAGAGKSSGKKYFDPMPNFDGMGKGSSKGSGKGGGRDVRAAAAAAIAQETKLNDLGLAGRSGNRAPAPLPPTPSQLADRIRNAQDEAEKRSRMDIQSAQAEAASRRGGFNPSAPGNQNPDPHDVKSNWGPADFLGSWVDSMGNSVIVYQADAYAGSLVAALSRPPRKDAQLPMTQMMDGGWMCGNAMLNTQVSSAERIQWVRSDGVISVWMRGRN